ncbi:hypothetical protein ACFW04_013583 [Cataglyphis niger]
MKKSSKSIYKKKKSVTKNGQAVLHFSPWPLMANLSFLSDAKSCKTVTNCQSFDIERPLSIDIVSPPSLERHLKEKNIISLRSLNMLSRPNSVSFRSNSISPCPSKALSHKLSISPHFESISSQKRTSIDFDTINSDNLFYLFIARDSQHLNVNAKLRLKTFVLQPFSSYSRRTK